MRGKLLRVMSVLIMISIVFVISFIIVQNILNKQKEIKEKEVIEGIEIYLMDEEISALIIDGNTIIVGGKNGVYRFDTKSETIVETITDELSLIYTADMVMTKDRVLWIGHDNGLSLYYENNDEENKWKHFISPDIPKGRCNTLKIIDDKVYAGFQEGVAIFRLKTDWDIMKLITIDDGLIEPVVQDIEFNNSGIWYGSYYCNKIGGISLAKDNSWEYLSLEDGLPHKYVTSMLPVIYDDKEYILVGTGHLESGGLAVVEVTIEGLNVVATHDIQSNLPGEKVRFLYQSKENVFITTESDGILITDLSKIIKGELLDGIYLNTNHGLSSDEIKVIVENNDSYWLGGKVGLTKIPKEVILLINAT